METSMTDTELHIPVLPVRDLYPPRLLEALQAICVNPSRATEGEIISFLQVRAPDFMGKLEGRRPCAVVQSSSGGMLMTLHDMIHSDAISRSTLKDFSDVSKILEDETFESIEDLEYLRTAGHDEIHGLHAVLMPDLMVSISKLLNEDEYRVSRHFEADDKQGAIDAAIAIYMPTPSNSSHAMIEATSKLEHTVHLAEYAVNQLARNFPQLTGLPFKIRQP
jgi:hypothetical protein